MTGSSHLKAWIALLAVYFFWGTTYLAIRMALESFPPILLISARFLSSGLIMVLAVIIRGEKLPRGRELWLTSLLGLMMLGIGNGALVFAEQWVPSGTAALFITTGPFWLVGVEAILPGGEKLHWPTMAGIVVGFAGVLILLAPSAMGAAVGPGLLHGFLLLQVGCFCWCTGSLLQRRLNTKSHPIVGGAVQQLVTGVAFLPLALLVPEHPVHWSARGVLALLWLITFGSIVGFSAFVYAINNLPVAIVSTYNYVNPIVAVALGWLFYREHFGVAEFTAMLTVFAGVAIVKYFSASGHHKRVASEEDALTTAAVTRD